MSGPLPRPAYTLTRKGKPKWVILPVDAIDIARFKTRMEKSKGPLEVREASPDEVAKIERAFSERLRSGHDPKAFMGIRVG